MTLLDVARHISSHVMDWITCVGLLDWWQTSAVSCSLARTEARCNVIWEVQWYRITNWMAGDCIGCKVTDSRDVNDVETESQRLLLQVKEAGLGMPSRDLSLNVFTRGLWSTATVRFGQPKTKWRAFSRASTRARAFPSIGAYRDSAPEVNRLPTRVVFHPVLQQKGRDDWHSQCFWNNQNPIPSLLQSLTRQVGLFLS